MLANAYLPAITAIFGAAASLLLAIVLELPILKMIWRRPLLRLAGWVLIANLVSAAVGMVPVFNDTGPGMGADPWEASQHWLRAYASRVALLFALTLLTEGAVYLILNRRALQRVPSPSLLIGILVGNLASYTVLFGLMLWGMWPDRSAQLLPDTNWLHAGDDRLWFVEPGSHHLCSIRLDGKDRRTELAEPLGRFDIGGFDGSVYAVLPGQHAIAFLSPDRDWRVHEPAGTRSLAITAEPNQRGFLDWRQVAEPFPKVIEKLREPENHDPDQVWSNTNPRLRNPVVMSDEAQGYHVRTVVAGGAGSGFGLSVEGPNRKLELKIPAGPAYLVCSEPAILPDRKLVVFRCSAWIMVMDIESGRTGRLVEGDSVVAVAPAFGWKRQGE
jgi:hypothetical protein